MFACQFGRYRFIRLLFWVAPAGDISVHNIDKIFKDLPTVFGIADGILIVEYDADGRHHDRTLRQVMKMCCYEKLNN